MEQQDAPQDRRPLFQEDNDIIIHAMQSLTFTNNANEEEDWKDRKKVAKEFHAYLHQ
jgi:hypothetical protein